MSDGELTYEPALDEGRREADKGSGAGDVMSNRPASIGNAKVERYAVSPISGVALPANSDTAARARAGKAAAKERYRIMAEQGLLTAAQAVREGVMTHEQAWGKVIEGQAELALSPDLRGSTQAAALVGKAIGALASDKVAEQQGNSINISLTDAAVAQIALALAGKLDSDE